MKKTKLITGILSLGLLSGCLTGCKFTDIFNIFKKKNKEAETTEKDPLVIPNVEVTSLNINLPSRPQRNVGEIRSDDNYEYIDLYELSDFHGAVSYESHSDGDYVGLPKLASYLDGKRSNNPGGTLVLSSGDMFQGSADSNLTRGFMVNYCMHYMGFDAMTIGNHEFDWGLDWLEKNAKLTYSNYSIPFLGANILKDGSTPTFLEKSTVVTRGDYKIGVVGVIGSDLESSVLKTALDGCEFATYSEIVASETARLKETEGCQAVVLLAHEGVDKIEYTTGIDAIFGGHAHKNKTYSYGQIPALATLNYGQSVGHIALKFDKNTKECVGSESGASIENMKDVASSLSENNDIQSIMDQYAPEINKIKHIKLGTADEKLKFDGALTNICTSAMFESAIDSVKVNNYTSINTDKIVAAFHNVNGGIRDDINAGDVTYGNVYKSFPFDNEVVLIKITGEEAKTKFSDQKIKQLGCYRLFEDRNYFTSSEEYYIVTTDYLAFSENGFANFRSQPLEDKDLIRTGRVVRDEVANKIYKLDQLNNKELLHSGDFHYAKIPMMY